MISFDSSQDSGVIDNEVKSKIDPSNSLVIETKNLSKTYLEAGALKDLNLKVQKHSIFGFLGPNEAGKTTAIKLLLGLARPTSGFGQIFGYDIQSDSISIRKRVGYLAQDPRFYEHMTARQTLRFTAHFFYPGPASEIEKRVEDTLVLVGLDDKADRPIKGFSGGERQSGTAAWVLSKPVSRPAFILSKLSASTIGILITGVVVQGAVAYLQLSLRSGFLWPYAGFLGTMGLVFLNLLFYLTLTYMLGSICTSRGPVLGIGLAMAMIGPALFRSLPIITDLTPWTFFLPITDEVPLGLAVALGQPPASVTPIIGTALMCLVFTAIAILHFQREEF